MNTTMKKYLVFMIGLLVFGFGLSFSFRSMLGANPMGVLVNGLANFLHIENWLSNLIIGIAETAIGFVLQKKNVTFATLIGVLFGSYAINIGNFFIPVSDEWTIRILYMIVGILLYCLGLAIQQVAHCGLGNLDCFIFGLGHALKIEQYYRIRWITDAFFLITGYLLGGVIHIGTVILIACGGLIIQFFRKQLEKIMSLN